MDSLYFIGKAQFHQLATHVAVYREDSSPSYRHLSSEALTAVGLNPASFAYWNVPLMSNYLGKAVPVDIHGGHVLIDEEKALSMASSYGVLRYALLSSAVRAREGGRWRYDFVSMNVTLGVGAVAGFGLLSFGRKRSGWMRRHPVGAVSVSVLAGLVTTVLARQGIKMLGVGVVQAQNSHKKALKRLGCIDCLEDVNDYTRNQIAELRAQKIPTTPGMPPPPEDYVKQFERGVEMQCKLLEVDMEEVRVIRKYSGGHLCDVHRGLRDDPKGYREPNGLPVLPRDRDVAAQRKEQSPVLPDDVSSKQEVKK